MVRHVKTIAWEQKLKKVFDRIDDILEKKYGDMYPLHPARPERGETSNKEHDGLFDLSAVFSAGFGSEHGRGYIVRSRIATLAEVPPEVAEKIEEEVAEMLRKELPEAFPGRNLDVTRDGHILKIQGDLSLGEV